METFLVIKLGQTKVLSMNLSDYDNSKEFLIDTLIAKLKDKLML